MGLARLPSLHRKPFRNNSLGALRQSIIPSEHPPIWYALGMREPEFSPQTIENKSQLGTPKQLILHLKQIS